MNRASKASAAGLLAVALLGVAACVPDPAVGGSEQEREAPRHENLAKRITAILDDAGAEQLGQVQLVGTALQVTYLDVQGSWVTASERSWSDQVSKSSGGDRGHEPLSLAEFPLRWLEETFNSAECGEASTWAELSTTEFGTLVGQVRCHDRDDGYRYVAAWLDGHEVAPFPSFGIEEIDAALHTASLLRSPLVETLNINIRDSHRVDGPELVLAGGEECSLITVVGGVDAGFVEHTGECQASSPGSRELFDFRHLSGARLVEVVQRAAAEKGHSPEDATMIYLSKSDIGYQALISFEGDLASADNSWLGVLS